MPEEPSLYQQLLAAGVPLDHHESDLFVLKTETSDRILRTYEHRSNVTTFIHPKDGQVWYDVPFAYDPYWERRSPL